MALNLTREMVAVPRTFGNGTSQARSVRSSGAPGAATAFAEVMSERAPSATAGVQTIGDKAMLESLGAYQGDAQRLMQHALEAREHVGQTPAVSTEATRAVILEISSKARAALESGDTEQFARQWQPPRRAGIFAARYDVTDL